ncbi:MAG: noncanonical pyrimidine nucleotidase, YjjG family [Flavobacteriales bacterium]|jgi:putative hydrolase of the HAD superfamily|nr:noncanonical pyrimidine nucleotidase, YjjG family [Flavobacteriales bacterium]|tara:strand:- start:5456 stop:6148 length:693 start_codon:yes stop_codon:yes gene_type:complete
MNISDIFLDLDRTLWDFDLNARKTLIDIFEKYSLYARGISSVDNFIEAYTIHNERLWLLYRENKISKELLRSERFNLTFLDFKIIDNELALEVGEEYINKCPLQTSLFPHTMEILNYLNNKYNLHIITNGFEEVQHIKLRASNLTSFFNNVITSEMVKVKKPNPVIFQYALDQANVIASNSIMIGDDLPVDILGAKAIGISQIYFNPKKEPHNEEIDYEIACLSEIKNIL